MDQEFPRDGDDNRLTLLTPFLQAEVKRPDVRVVAYRADRCHVERSADLGSPSAFNRSVAVNKAALPVHRSQSSQASDLLSVGCPQFRHEYQQGQARPFADADDGHHQLALFPQHGIRFHELREFGLVTSDDFFLGFDFTADLGLDGAVLVAVQAGLAPGALLDEEVLTALEFAYVELSDPVLAECGGTALCGELRDVACVDGIGFRPLAEGLDEVLDLACVALADWNAFFEATADEQILVRAGRLTGDPGCPSMLPDSGKERLDSAGVVGKGFDMGFDACAKFVLRNIDSDLGFVFF